MGKKLWHTKALVSIRKHLRYICTRKIHLYRRSIFTIHWRMN